MNYLDFLSGWHAGWVSGRDSQLSLELRIGSESVARRSASIAAESPAAVGSVIVWESGDLEVEVVDLQSMARTYVDSGVIDGPEDFAMRMSKFVRACLPR